MNELIDPRKAFGEAVIEAAQKIRMWWYFPLTAVQDQVSQISRNSFPKDILNLV